MIWWLIGSVTLNLVLIFVSWNILRKNDEAEGYVNKLEDYIANLLNASRSAIENMRQVDLSGAFEADDEIGVTFQALHEVIADYAEVMGVEPDQDKV